jgi:hypothetical protein
MDSKKSDILIMRANLIALTLAASVTLSAAALPACTDAQKESIQTEPSAEQLTTFQKCSKAEAIMSSEPSFVGMDVSTHYIVLHHLLFLLLS